MYIATEEAFLTHIFFCRDSEIASFLQNQTKTANRTTMLLSCFQNEGIHLRVSCTLLDSFAWFGLSLDFIMRLKVNFCVFFLDDAMKFIRFLEKGNEI